MPIPRSGRGWPGALLGLVLLIGCQEQQPSVPPDLGPTDARPPDTAPPLVIERPRLTDWTCPEGWQPETVAEGSEVEHTVCAPPEQLDCAAGQAQFLGERRCGPIGTRCPDGAFADEAAIRDLAPGFTGKVRYVKPGPPDGDGSRDAPWPTIDHALAVAQPGDVIALAKESFYVDGVIVRARIAIVGACVSDTEIMSLVAEPLLGVVTVTDEADGALIANLSLRGARPGLLLINGETKPVTITGVEIDGAVGVGAIAVAGSRASLSRLVVRDTQDVSTRVPGNEVMGGQGLQLEAPTTVHQALLEGNTGRGINLVNSSESIECELDDIVVRDTAPGADHDMSGRGMVVGNGVQLRLRRALLEGNLEAGLQLAHTPEADPPLLEAEDLVIRDTRGRAWDRRGGVGLSIVDGARATATRMQLLRNRFAGLLAEGTAGALAPSLSISDLVIRDTRGQEADDIRGFGLVAQAGAQISIQRAVLEQNRGVALFVNATAPEAYQPPSVTLSDIYIAGTLSSEVTATGGFGIAAQHGADVTLTRGILDGNRSAAVLAGADEGREAPTVSLEHAIIRNTAAASCAELAADDPRRCVYGGTSAGGGSGVAARHGARVTLALFEVAHSAHSGLVVGPGGSIEATQGEIHHNVIGLNVQDPAFDTATVTDPTVRFYENETNHSAETLPLPELPTF